MYYVAVDIGCIECCEDSGVLGIFTDEKKAEEVIKDHRERALKFACGKHIFFIEKFKDVNDIHRVTYDEDEEEKENEQ